MGTADTAFFTALAALITAFAGIIATLFVNRYLKKEEIYLKERVELLKEMFTFLADVEHDDAEPSKDKAKIARLTGLRYRALLYCQEQEIGAFDKAICMLGHADIMTKMQAPDSCFASLVRDKVRHELSVPKWYRAVWP